MRTYKAIPLGFKIVLSAAFIAFIVWQGCESTNPIIQPSQIVFPDSNISYSKYVQPMFNLSCTYAGCHDDQTMMGGLSLTSWVQANADPGNIVVINGVGHPDSSKLCQILEHKLPHGGAPLDTIQNHIMGVRRWVIEGAKNN